MFHHQNVGQKLQLIGILKIL